MLLKSRIPECFIYLGSNINSSGRSGPEIQRQASWANCLTSGGNPSSDSLLKKIKTVQSLCCISASVWLRGVVLLQTSGDLRHFTCRSNDESLIYDVTTYFVTNTTLLDQTKEESIISRIQRRRMAVFGHIRRLQEQAPAHAAMCLAVDTRAGRKPDNRQQWRRARGRPRNTWIRQVEVDSGLSADAAGTLLVIVVGRWRNDPRWLRVHDDDDDDDELVAQAARRWKAQERWCPHGTNAGRVSRCCTRHTSHKSCDCGSLTAD